MTLNTHFCQEKFYSSKVFLDFDWSSGERELVDMIRALHDEGLHVMLKPCLTSLDSAWMGAVTFPWPTEQQIQGVRQRYAVDWFDSLRECLTYFGDIAEETGCEALIVGAEYNGTTKFDEEWRKNYQLFRNVLRITKNNSENEYVVFLFPKMNKAAKAHFERFKAEYIDPAFDEHIKEVFWEDLTEYMSNKFRQKFFFYTL